MGTIGVKEAYEQGAKAYHEGLDVMNMPGYLTDIERENWIAAYEGEMYSKSAALEDYDGYDETDNDYIGLNGESMTYDNED